MKEVDNKNNSNETKKFIWCGVYITVEQAV